MIMPAGAASTSIKSSSSSVTQQLKQDKNKKKDIIVLPLDRWDESGKDYEILRRVLPNNNDIAESLFQAQVPLNKSHGEDVKNMKFGDEVEVVTYLDQFKAEVASSEASVVFYKT